MALATIRMTVVAKEPMGSNNGQRKITLIAKKGASENTQFRGDQSIKQQVVLEWDTLVEKAIFTVGSDVLVSFNGPA